MGHRVAIGFTVLRFPGVEQVVLFAGGGGQQDVEPHELVTEASEDIG